MTNKNGEHKNFSVILRESANVTAPPAFDPNEALGEDKEKQWSYYFIKHADEVKEVLDGTTDFLCVHFTWIEEKIPSFAEAMQSDEMKAGSYIGIGNIVLRSLYIDGHEPQKSTYIRFNDNTGMAEIAEEVHTREEKAKNGGNITETLKIFKKWLYMEHDTDITIPLAYVVSNYTAADPGCMAIVAPSGSYKTELLRALGEKENEFVYPLDNLTSHTFISGLPKVEDVIPDIQRRLITIKDFTALLSKREDERTVIFSDIREMLDGYMSRSFGSGKRVTYRDIHSSLLIASTNAIERYYSLNATLGQRMIFFRPSNDPTKARERALKNMNNTEEMRKELHTATKRLLSHLIIGNRQLENIGDGLTEDAKEIMGTYTDFVAIIRTHVKRNFKGHIEEIPEPEFPTRLFKEIIKIIECHAILYKREVSEDDLKAGLLVLYNNVPRERLRLIRKLAEEPITGFHTTEIATSLSLSSYMVKERLEELLMLKLIYRESFIGGNRGDKWRIVPRYRSLIQHFLDFDIDLAVGGNLRRGIYINRKYFFSDLLDSYVIDINYINSVKECVIKERSVLNLIDVYTSAELPPPLNICKECKKDSWYMSRYEDKLLCDACLEQKLIPKNVCGKCGDNKKTTQYKGEWLCDECISELVENESGKQNKEKMIVTQIVN